jgi:hypothetical protein
LEYALAGLKARTTNYFSSKTDDLKRCARAQAETGNAARRYQNYGPAAPNNLQDARCQAKLRVAAPAQHFVNLRQMHFFATNFAAGELLQRNVPSFAELEQLPIKLDTSPFVNY